MLGFYQENRGGGNHDRRVPERRGRRAGRRRSARKLDARPPRPEKLQTMRGELQGLGPFRLLGVVGEGERAVVYHAEREGAGAGATGYALRILRPSLKADADAARAFEERAQAGAGLAGDAIVSTYEVGRLEGRPYALQERVDGVPLGALFPKKGKARFSEAAATTLLHGVLKALVMAGEARPPLVHGRLDAGSVLLDQDGDVRVVGFGAPGDPRADFLDLARLAQQVIPDGAPALDGWLDGLQDGSDRYANPRAVLEALPLGATGDGRRALGRAVKRALKKREEARELRESGQRGHHHRGQASDDRRDDDRHEGGRERGATTARRPKGRPAPPEDVSLALRQARWVGALCAVLLLVALLLEIT